MEEKIFKPLGMTDSTFDYAKGMAGNWAAPHGLDVDGRVTLMSNDFNFAPYPYRPAGAAFSTTADMVRSEEHTSELQSLMRISYAVFCLKKNKRRPSNRSWTFIDRCYSLCKRQNQICWRTQLQT